MQTQAGKLLIEANGPAFYEPHSNAYVLKLDTTAHTALGLSYPGGATFPLYMK